MRVLCALRGLVASCAGGLGCDCFHVERSPVPAGSIGGCQSGWGDDTCCVEESAGRFPEIGMYGEGSFLCVAFRFDGKAVFEYEDLRVACAEACGEDVVGIGF